MRHFSNVAVPRGTRYVNIGVELDGELCLFEVNFISNSKNWGVFLTLPNGDMVIELRHYKTEEIEKNFTYEGHEFYVGVYLSESDIVCEIIER